jgi:PhnB protein
MVPNCREALPFYQKVFGGELQNIQTADDKEMFKGHEGKIVHAELHVNSQCLFYFGDIFQESAEAGNIGLILELDSEEEINRLYSLLSQNGSVKYELQKTFWGALHAVITDSYGVSWSLNFTQP